MESSLAGGTLTVPDIAKYRQIAGSSNECSFLFFLGCLDQNNNFISTILLTFTFSSYILRSLEISLNRKGSSHDHKRSTNWSIREWDQVLQVMTSLKFQSPMETRSHYRTSSSKDVSKMDHPRHRVKTFGEEAELEINTDLAQLKHNLDSYPSIIYFCLSRTFRDNPDWNWNKKQEWGACHQWYNHCCYEFENDL